MAAKVETVSLMKDLFSEERTPGHHVSGAVNRMLVAIDPKRYKRDDSAIPHNYFAFGHAVEAALAVALEKKYPGRFHRIGELELDNVTGTPDLLDLEPDSACPICGDNCGSVVDVKLTKQSARKLEDPGGEWLWKYWVQIKSYAKMLGLHRGAVMLVFINGDYRGSIDPSIVLVTDEWTEEDLDENWGMILRNQGEPE